MFGERNVETAEECQNVTNHILSVYPDISASVREVNIPNYPSGCVVYSQIGSNFGIYFNQGQVDSEGHSRPLCEKPRGKNANFHSENNTYYRYSEYFVRYPLH